MTDTAKSIFVTKEDRVILDKITELKGRKADVFHLFINGMTPQEIANGLGLSYTAVSHALGIIKHIFNVDSCYQLLSEILPAMIRKECEENMQTGLESGE